MWPKTNRTDLVAWRPSVTRWAAVGWVGRGSTAAHCDWWWGCPRPLCRTVVGRLDPASGGRPGRRVPPTCPCRGSRSGCPWWWRCGRAGSRPRPAWRWTPAPRDEGGFKLLIFWHIRFANLVQKVLPLGFIVGMENFAESVLFRSAPAPCEKVAFRKF